MLETFRLHCEDEIFKVFLLILKNIHPGLSFVLLFSPERSKGYFSLKEVNPSLYCKMTKHITLIWTTFSGYFNNFTGTCRRMTTVKARAQLRIKISLSLSYSSQNLKVAFVRASDRSVFPAVAEEY